MAPAVGVEPTAAGFGDQCSSAPRRIGCPQTTRYPSSMASVETRWWAKALSVEGREKRLTRSSRLSTCASPRSPAYRDSSHSGDAEGVSDVPVEVDDATLGAPTPVDELHPDAIHQDD
jgi:hypothetical protein